MDVLIVAIETGRWGPARLPHALKTAGLTVAALCPADNAIAATDFLDRHYALPASRSARPLAKALAAAIRDCRPALIVPADEQTVALLHSFVRKGPGVLDAQALATIVRSLGRPAQFDAMLMKSDTLALARTLGIAVPAGGTVASADGAAALAAQIGFPVYLKSSFGWAGQGVTRCEDAAALHAACPAPPSRLGALKALARHWMGRDWYPNSPAVDVQGAIAGKPAMYCAVAWQGKMLAGFAGIPRETVSATGPSSVVWLGAHPAMAEATERMVAAMGATGFIGFDFMLDDATGAPLLLECNPRPIQVCHLGERIGADLMAPLAEALVGRIPPGPAIAPDREVEVALFPHAARRDDFGQDVLLDVPWDDRGLRDYAEPQKAEPQKAEAQKTETRKTPRNALFAPPPETRISPVSG